MSRFRDRTDAGRRLASALVAYAHDPTLLVLALPRGGVPVAFEVARALHAPLDVLLVRKLGLPANEEYAMGAIASGGLVVLDRSVKERFGVSDAQISQSIERERRELERREQLYRGNRALPEIAERTVILVDDGLATGATMFAAIAALREKHPKRIVVAVPIGPPETCEAMRARADDVVCADTADPFMAIGIWYDDFSQTTDDEVRDLLDRAEHEWSVASE